MAIMNHHHQLINTFSNVTFNHFPRLMFVVFKNIVCVFVYWLVYNFVSLREWSRATLAHYPSSFGGVNQPGTKEKTIEVMALFEAEIECCTTHRSSRVSGPEI